MGYSKEGWICIPVKVSCAHTSVILQVSSSRLSWSTWVEIPPCLTFVPTFSAESVGCYDTLFKEYRKAKARLHLVRDKQTQGMCQAGGSCSLAVIPYWPALHRAGNAQEVKGMRKHMQISQQNDKPLSIVSKSTFTYRHRLMMNPEC